jgi:thiamine biosynthesis lipoprotein
VRLVSVIRYGNGNMIRRARPLLGTFVEITIDGAAPDASERAIDAAFAAIAQAHALMSYHEPASDVGRLNRAAARPVVVHDWTLQVVRAAIELGARSSGLFNIAVAPVLEDLGLLPQVSRICSPERPRIDDAVELMPGCRVRLRRPDVRIDLGGIAKGFAVDRAVGVLRAHRIRSGIVNAGGDLFGFGPDPHPIHIRDPRNPAALSLCVMVRNQALATSGPRFDPFHGRATADCAVIDPRDGTTVRGAPGVTVRAMSCMVADALTKVVMIDGEEAGDLLEHYGASAMLTTVGGEIRASSDWGDVAYRAS